MGEGHLVRQQVHNPLRHGNILCKRAHTPELSRGNTNDLALIAEIPLTTLAEKAPATVHGGIERDAISFTKRRHRSSDRSNRPCGLMTHHQRRDPPPGAAVVSMNVAAADAARAHGDQNLVLTRLRNREVDHLQALVVRELQCPHTSPFVEEKSLSHDMSAILGGILFTIFASEA